MTDFGPIGSDQNMAGATLIQDQSKLFAQMKACDWENRQSMPAPSTFDANSKWASGYNSVWGNGPKPGANPWPEDLYWSTLNQELQVFPTGDCIRDVADADPFTSWNDDGSLNILPRPLTQAERATMTGQNTAVWNRVKLNSGAFCSYPAGIPVPYLAEIRCKMPKGQGTWPAWWLIPTSGVWPPELDVFEGVSGQLTTSIHSANDTSWQQAARDAGCTWVSGPGEGHPRATHNLAGNIADWHWYGAAVYSDHIGIFVDRKLVWTWVTPRDHAVPMHIMANFAVGGPGDWPGTPPDPNGPYDPLVVSDIGIYAMPAEYGQGSEPVPPDPGPGPEPSEPTTVAITVVGPDTVQVTLEVNGAPVETRARWPMMPRRRAGKDRPP